MADMSLVDLGKRLLEAAKLGETEEVRVLMTNGAPFTTDWLGTSPLHMTAQYGHLRTAEVLLRGGISRDGRTKVDRTPLHIAAQEGHLDIVKLLVSHGSEVDSRDMLRMTPLHWAVERGHYHVAKFLLKQNANVHALSKFEKSPLNIAEDNQHVHIIELLSTHAVQALTKEVVEKHSASKKPKIIQVSHSNLTSMTQVLKTPIPVILKPDALKINTKSVSSSSVTNVAPSYTTFTNSSIAVGAVKSNTARSPTITKPVFLQTNFSSKNSTTSAVASSSDSEEGETNGQGSTNVLATLAALAEATAPNATISTSEALQWLEMNGITMLPTDNSTIIASALEGGQTVSLTEAGKLALTWMKDHQNLANSSINLPPPPMPEKNEDNRVTASQSSTTQKVITIVADQGRIPSIISSPQTPIVVLSSPNVKNEFTSPPAKKFKTIKSEDSQYLFNGNSIHLTTSSVDDERSKLKEELEKTKREAELYKTQLLQKEHEAEEYRKQLERMRTNVRD